jgi:hypothetical protein
MQRQVAVWKHILCPVDLRGAEHHPDIKQVERRLDRYGDSWPEGTKPLDTGIGGAAIFRPRALCSPANPSEEGGLEEFVEFRLRSAS